MTTYITGEELKATLEISGQTYADSDVTAAVLAASRGIDEACNRRFYPDTDANQIRYYTPQLLDKVVIDDLITFTALDTDQTGDGSFGYSWIQNTDFVLEPLNAPANSEPWTALRAHPRHRLTFGFPSYYPRSVRVTGKFGWAATPDAIVEATTILAAQLLKRSREAPFGIVAFGDTGAVSRLAVTDPSVKFLLQRYIRERPQP